MGYSGLCIPFVLSSVFLPDARTQVMPDVRCHVEDYSVRGLIYGWVGNPPKTTQVVVLSDPAGEQEARFDLTQGGALISLRYNGKEVLYGQTPGASVSLFQLRPGTDKEQMGLPPDWAAYNPSQAGRSFRVPATTAGVGCEGQDSMRAFAMMIDGKSNSAFVKQPLVAVWKGEISNTFPPAYSTPITIETNAGWVENPGKTPRYYLRLDQSVANVRPDDLGAADWLLEAETQGRFLTRATFPECTEKKPCISAGAPVIVAGQYEDPARNFGFATVIPTAAWQSGKIFVRDKEHGFTTVLERKLDGLSAFHFTWYGCAGGWEQARAFSARMGR